MSFPIDAVRAKFPALDAPDAGRRRIYFDNPAGTQLPASVIEAVTDAMVHGASNYGGYFENSKRAVAIKNHAHDAMADMTLSPSPQQLIMGPNMTTLTMHLSRSLGRRFNPGDEIIVTRMDHEGDVSPWLLMAEDRGLKVRWLPFNRDSWRIETEDLSALLNERTRLLALSYASNLTGSINDVRSLVALAKDAGALTFVDAVQLAPHARMDVGDVGCDFMVCSSYKFFGPHMGILWGRLELLEELEAYKVRCASNTLPTKFETGTPQTELLAGLGATVDYFAALGSLCGGDGKRAQLITHAFEAATEYESSLTRKLIGGLQAIPGVNIHGITNPNRLHERVPTVSFTHADHAPKTVAEALAKHAVCVWSGHNYAYEVVRYLGIPEESGVVRIGLAHYNTMEEVEHALSALETILN